MTIYHVPHLALGAEMSADFQERTQIVAFRQFFGTFGGACASVIGLGYFFADANGGRLTVDNYAPYAVTLALLMVITIWYSAYGTQKEIPHLSIPKAKSTASVFGRLSFEIREAFKSHSFRWLFSGVLVISIMGGVTAALDLYMLQYFWEFSGYDMLTVQVSMIAGLMVGAFFTSMLHRTTSKRFTILLGAIGYSIFQFTPVVLRLVDWFPGNGEASLVYLLTAMKFVQGMVLQQALVSWGSMIADVTDEHELSTGLRQEGLFFGASSFSAKATSGLGSFIGGIGLDLINWPRGADVKNAGDVPVDTIVNLGLLYGPFVAGFAVVAIWCYSHYGLTREKHAEILRVLGERRRDDERAATGHGQHRPVMRGPGDG
jgi:Na+/melibiose symporter-like transporter